ncbi:eukaryotic translation initiation factor 3 subunit A [Trifolium repens]|nr:eukaryotic translation initiation factor 3 subunit A [Trifolium repens]
MSFLKPDYALKRAEDLINVGPKQEALYTLHDLITSKRYRTWQKTHELVMFKYVELCVEMRKGQLAKDGLIQYRSICQNVNVSSLEEVIKHFINLSTKKVKQACSEAQTLEQGLDVDDLEAYKRPEDLMMSYVGGEKGKDISDQELVTPCFKFLWESYKIVLEILQNNSKFEALYAETAHRAFEFCKQYKRKTEFRRLCGIIRNHLANLIKYRDQPDRPDLSSPESLQLYLRFNQLKISAELELWQEAFRSAEDIHGLMCVVRKTPKPSMMSLYYVKFTEIFWISSSHLYHAYAWLKLFSLQKSFHKSLSQKDMELIASAVVLSALSVPPYENNSELEHEMERNLKMANLICFNLENKTDSKTTVFYFPSFALLMFCLYPVSRSSLLAELELEGVMSYAAQEVKDIYYLLEHKFLPSDLSLESLEADDLRDRLAGFAKQLNKARQMICPLDGKQSKLELLLPCLLEVVAKDHKMILARKSIIEKRKEEQEQQLLEMV